MITTNKKPHHAVVRFFGVDPARFALASLLVDGRILLHKLRARIHNAIVAVANKKQKPSKRKGFCPTSSGSIVCMNSTVILILIILIILSSVPTQTIAANFQSSNFDVRDPVISDFGGKSTSGSFEQYNTGGGQAVTGESSSSNFLLRSGFFYFDTLTLKSQNWRWYDDEVNETPVTALAAENVAPSNIDNRAKMKLRATIKETQDIGGTIKLKLQYSKNSNFSSGINDVVEQGACTLRSHWCYTDGGGADNGVITTGVISDADSCVASVGDGCGTHNESGTSGATFNHKKSAAVEYEFTIQAYDPEWNMTYFFRAFDTTNNLPVALNTGENYPSLSTGGTTLAFAIGGVASGTVTEGITTDVTTTATTVPFGTLSTGGTKEGAQRLTITTNAAEGYQVLVKQNQALIHASYGGIEIAGVDGTNVAPAAWAIPAGLFGGYGYHAGDGGLSGGSTRFASDDTYAKLESTMKEIAFNSGPVDNESVDIIYKVEIGNQQQSGDYLGNVEYIIVPIF